jgi:hypothetical protein
MTNRYWDEEEEFKGEKVYETREGRLRALNHIIRKYIEKTQGVKINYRESVPMSMTSIIEIIENDVDFRKFTFDNYRVFIHNDENDRVHVRKITYEMEELIKQHEQNLDDKEFQDKLFSLEDDLHAKGIRTDQQKRMEKVQKNINYEDTDTLKIFQQLGEITATTGNEQEHQQIRDAAFTAIREAEYYKFLKTMINKSFNLNLPKEWYIGTYFDVLTGKIGFTEPFITKHEKGNKLKRELNKETTKLQKQFANDKKIIFCSIKSMNLDFFDNNVYYIIPETGVRRFVEIADNKGYVDPDFSFEYPDYNNNKKHFKNDLSSIRKYDDAVEIFIKDCIRTSGFMYDTFENYLDMKLEYMEQQLDKLEEEAEIREGIPKKK